MSKKEIGQESTTTRAIGKEDVPANRRSQASAGLQYVHDRVRLAKKGRLFQIEWKTLKEGGELDAVEGSTHPWFEFEGSKEAFLVQNHSAASRIGCE